MSERTDFDFKDLGTCSVYGCDNDATVRVATREHTVSFCEADVPRMLVNAIEAARAGCHACVSKPGGWRCPFCNRFERAPKP